MTLEPAMLQAAETLAEALYEALATRIDAIRLGDPLGENTDMGPMTSQRQRDRVRDYLAVAEHEGLDAVRGLFSRPAAR